MKQSFDSGHYCRIMSPWMTSIFWPYNTVVLFVSPQLLLQYLMQGFESCNTVQPCIEHVHKGNRIWIRSCFAQLCTLEYTYFDHITLYYGSWVRNSSYSIWCGNLKLATQFRHALSMCMKKIEFWSRSLLQNFVPVHNIHAHLLSLL